MENSLVPKAILWQNDESEWPFVCFSIFHVKRKIHYPFKWIQLIEWSNYLNMNSCLHLSNQLKECSKFLWIRLWNLCFISMKESIFSKITGCKLVISHFVNFRTNFSVVFPLLMPIFKKMCSNLAREFEISDNNRKKLDESWTRPTFLQLNGRGENCRIF